MAEEAQVTFHKPVKPVDRFTMALNGPAAEAVLYQPTPPVAKPVMSRSSNQPQQNGGRFRTRHIIVSEEVINGKATVFVAGKPDNTIESLAGISYVDQNEAKVAADALAAKTPGVIFAVATLTYCVKADAEVHLNRRHLR